MKVADKRIKDEVFWRELADLLITAAWVPFVTLWALVVITFWTDDWRFAATGAVTAAVGAALIIAGLSIRDWKIPRDARRGQYVRRVRARAPLCLVVGGVAIAVALVLFVAAIWAGSGDTAQTAIVTLILGVAVCLYGADMN